MNLKRLLCPTDFSEASARALHHASALAERLPAELTVIHVFQRPIPYGPFGGKVGYLPTLPDRSELLERLASHVEPVRASGIAVHLELVEGHPASAIAEHAKMAPADLIVMGTHGLRGFDRWILGSVTEGVLHKAPCPVLTVPPKNEAAHPPGVYARVLCAVDLVDSEPTLTSALALAQQGAHLTVLHAVEQVSDDPVLSQLPLEVPEYGRILMADARKALRKAVPSRLRSLFGIEEMVVPGRAYKQILRVAKDTRADLIVMGVHRRNPIDLAFLGSTANHVVRQADCPVLAIRGASGPPLYQGSGVSTGAIGVR
jgi:nucleotide-binding universal stress UspA family protein